MSFDVERQFGEQNFDEDDKTKGASEVWRVISDTANPGLLAAKNAPGIPPRGASYPGDFYLQVHRQSVRQLTDYLFHVTNTYKPVGGDGAGNEGDGDPLTQPPDVSYAPVTYEEVADSDITGSPIQTINNEPFDPALMVEHSDVAITITANVAGFSPADILLYQDHTNADVWKGAPIGTAKVVFYGAEEIRNAEGDIEYYRRTVTIQVRMRKDPAGDHIGWRRKVLHQGFLVFSGVVIQLPNGDFAKQISHALDSSGNRVTEPVLLGVDGQKLIAGDAADFLFFDVYHSVDFASMNLGI